MSIPFENKRFRINPVEIAVFAVVGLIFVKSGYNLVYSHEGFEAAALTATAQDPIRIKDRNPASIASTIQTNFSEVKIGCDPTVATASVTSNKIRLIGSVCKPVENTADPKEAKVDKTSSENAQASGDGMSPPTRALTSPQSQPGVAAATPEAAESVKTISVVNTSARVSATVFPDFHNERFSTDYISLAPGVNTIHVQYEFKDGQTLGQEFSVTKN